MILRFGRPLYPAPGRGTWQTGGNLKYYYPGGFFCTSLNAGAKTQGQRLRDHAGNGLPNFAADR